MRHTTIRADVSTCQQIFFQNQIIVKLGGFRTGDSLHPRGSAAIRAARCSPRVVRETRQSGYHTRGWCVSRTLRGATMSFEVEIKFRTDGHAELARRLAALGGGSGPAIDQEDAYLSHPARDFARSGEAL